MREIPQSAERRHLEPPEDEDEDALTREDIEEIKAEREFDRLREEGE